MPTAFGYGLATALIIFLIAPYIQNLIGEEYADVDTLLRLVAFLPLVVALQILGGDTLTGANYQSYRSSVQVFSAGLNIVLNIWLIPLYSWYGAAWATMASESAKVVGTFAIIFYLLKRDGQASVDSGM
ncbi:MAG: polysaccharide biosynthesis C-terminal domain-containing protein [Leptolyngbyaceae cyanobacterium]